MFTGAISVLYPYVLPCIIDVICKINQEQGNKGLIVNTHGLNNHQSKEMCRFCIIIKTKNMDSYEGLTLLDQCII